MLEIIKELCKEFEHTGSQENFLKLELSCELIKNS